MKHIRRHPNLSHLSSMKLRTYHFWKAPGINFFSMFGTLHYLEAFNIQWATFAFDIIWPTMLLCLKGHVGNRWYRQPDTFFSTNSVLLCCLSVHFQWAKFRRNLQKYPCTIRSFDALGRYLGEPFRCSLSFNVRNPLQLILTVQGGPLLYQWSYNPHKWTYKWVTRVITLQIRGYNSIYNW